MKISFDNTKKKQILDGLEDLSSYLESTINYASGISIPYDFGRRSDITNTCLNALKKSKSIVTRAHHWYTNTNEAFENKEAAIKVRMARIEKMKINKKDLLVK